MNIYIVILSSASDKLWESLSQSWGRRFHVLNDKIAFIAPIDETSIEEWREILGMNSSRKRSGLVIEFNYDKIEGWESKEFWDWLEEYGSQ